MFDRKLVSKLTALLFLFLREQMSKWKMRDIVKEFSLLCRGLQGAEDTTDY